MILLPGGDGVVAIGQASHAWISGQLARAWGNDRFPAPSPREEVCLGAEQHDVGMAEWDLAPDRNPRTGLPTQFHEMDRLMHLALWTAAPARMLTQSRYAALLISLHGTGLYERFPVHTDDPTIARAIEEYAAGQRTLQDELAAQLAAPPDELARNRALMAAWDALSLLLCMDQPTGVTPDVATCDGAAGITITRHDDHHTLDPWPLAAEALEVRAEGRRLVGSFPDTATLRAALHRAPVVSVRFVLRPARPGTAATVQ